MKKFAILLIFFFSLLSCRKTLEEKARDIVVNAMVSGKWSMTHFTLDGANITTDFTGYSFQFFENETVDAIKNNTVEATGTRKGDAANMNISAHFTSVSEPLSLINGTWSITNNSWTFVEAKQNPGSQVKTLRLDKL